MKALSIHQPWAWAILHAGKRVENRTWQTHYRGPLLIHASKSRASHAALNNALWQSFCGQPLPAWTSLTTGALLGIVELVECLHLDQWHTARRRGDLLAALWDEAMLSPWAEGPWCWVLAKPRVFAEPVPWRGSQGLFEVEEMRLEVREPS
jgi:hypothetical protein